MNTGQEPNPAEFLPGDRVRIVDGTFVGKVGRVVDLDEATALWKKNGGQIPSSRYVHAGQVCAVIELFGRSVPVWFEPFQLAFVESSDSTQ